MEICLEIATDAGRFIRQHSLSSALNAIRETVGETYQEVDQIIVDLREDPEIEDFQCLAVTLRLRGGIAEILESERKARSLLRTRLAAGDYKRFVLTYELPS